MPALGPLALRYLIWLIGLRILYILAVNFIGVPNALATTVILASVPAVDIGMQAARRATRRLDLKAWGMIWGVMISVYLIINVIVPVMAVPAFRIMLAEAEAVRLIAITSVSTAAMLALFLFIGARSAGRVGGRDGRDGHG